MRTVLLHDEITRPPDQCRWYRGTVAATTISSWERSATFSQLVINITSVWRTTHKLVQVQPLYKLSRGSFDSPAKTTSMYRPKTVYYYYRVFTYQSGRCDTDYIGYWCWSMVRLVRSSRRWTNLTVHNTISAIKPYKSNSASDISGRWGMHPGIPWIRHCIEPPYDVSNHA